MSFSSKPNITCGYPAEARQLATDVRDGFKSIWDMITSGTYDIRPNNLYLGPPSGTGYINMDSSTSLPIWTPGDGTSNQQLTKPNFAQVKVVSSSGGNYTPIQSAIDAITDATTTKRYLVLICPGVYAETITCKDYVDLLGWGSEGSVNITGTTSRMLIPANCIAENLTFTQSGSPAATDTVSIYANGSNTPNNSLTTTNFHNSSSTVPGYLYANRFGNSNPLLNFDLSFLAGQTVTSANMHVFVNTASGVGVLPKMVLLGVKRTVVDTEATWIVYSTGNSWQTAGGYGANDISAITATSSATLTTGWNSVGNFSTVIQDCIDNSYTCIKASTEFIVGHYFSFYHPDSVYPPYLEITYSPSSMWIVEGNYSDMIFHRCNFSGTTTYTYAILHLGTGNLDFYDCKFSTLLRGIHNGNVANIKIFYSQVDSDNSHATNAGTGTIESHYNRYYGSGTHLVQSAGTFYSLADDFSTTSGTITFKGSTSDTDTVDLIHASSTATANKLYPLNASAVFPHEVGGLEADISAYNGLIKVSGGATSQVTDNSTNWNTAYGWGDHAGLYLKLDQTTPQSVINGTPSFADLKIPNQSLGTPTYSTINDFCNSFGSTGRKTGGVITDAGSSYIAVTAGTGFIKATDDDNAQLKFFNWSAPSNILIPASSTRYIGIEYNAGTPQVVSRTSFNWDLDTEFPLGRVINENINGVETLHILNNPWWVTDGTTNIIERVRSLGLMKRDETIGGLVPSVTGTRNLSVTGGTLWSQLNEFVIPALDTSVSGSFEYYWYNSSSGWQVSDATAYSVTQWNDTALSSLQTIDNNKYCVLWVYAESDDNAISVLYPQAQYNTVADAEAAESPTLVPTHILSEGVLIGRIIIKQGVDAPVSVESAFGISFTNSVVSDHGNLSGLTDDDHAQYFLTDGSRKASGSILPNADATLDLGSVGATDYRFRHLYLSGNLSDETNTLSVANAKTAYDHSQDNTQAHSDYLLNSGDDTTTGILTAEGGFTAGKNGVGGTAALITLNDGANPGTSETITYVKWNSLNDANGIVKSNGSGSFSAVTDNSANWDTAYSHSQDNTQAHSDYLVNDANDSTTGELTMKGLHVTDDGFDLNSDAAASGADWKYTLQRPAAGMTGAVTLTLPVDDGTPDQFLKTNGSGVLSWVTATGTGDVTASANMDDHTLIRGDGGTKGIQDSGITVDDSNNISGVGTLSCGALTATLNSTTFEVLTGSNTGIADSDTDSLVFSFVPSKIIVHYNVKTVGTGGYVGVAKGDCTIIITGTDTMTSQLYGISTWDGNGYPTFSHDSSTNSYIVNGNSHNSSTVYATGTWTTATKTLALTYQETGTTTGSNIVSWTAIAYK